MAVPFALLMPEFRVLEIYASCAVAVYFYELIVSSSSKDVKWYKAKSWSVPEIVCFFLEKFTTVAYCIITLIFLHLTSHTQLSCTLLLSLQQGFFALSTTFHCFMLLIRLRIFYPNRPYLAVSLFLFATMTILFQLINIIGFGKVEVNKLDGNCYLSGESGKLTGFFSVGFIMMMVYCWIIWAVIGFSIYFKRQQFYNKNYWRRILFEDGFMYLSLIALSQAINVVFILDGKNYLRQYINLTPLLVLTSICTQKSLINTKHEEKGISSRSISGVRSLDNSDNPKQNVVQFERRPQSLGTFIDQFYLQEQLQREQNYQRQTYQPREQSYQNQRQTYQPRKQSYQNQRQTYQPREQSYQNQRQTYQSREQSYQNQRQTYQQEEQDYSRQSYQQQEQDYSQQNYPQEYSIRIPSPTHSSFTASTKVDSIPPSLPPIIVHKSNSSVIEEEDDNNNSYTEYQNEQRSTKEFGSFLLDYFNKITSSSPAQMTARDSEQYNSRISKFSRLGNSNMNGTSHFSLDSSRLSQGIRKSQQGPILVDPNDIYYFTYSSDNDNEVYLFPAIQIPSDQREHEEHEEHGEENSFNNDTRKSNESLAPSIRHQSFAFTAKIIPDENDDDLDNRKIVRVSDVQSILSRKKYNDEKYTSYQEDIQN